MDANASIFFVLQLQYIVTWSSGEVIVRGAKAFAFFAGFSAFVLIGFIFDRVAQRHYLREGETQSKTALRLMVEALDGYLRRFMAVPELLSDAVELRRLIEKPEDESTVAAMNDWLTAKNAELDASAIYVLDIDGKLVATSSSDRGASLIDSGLSRLLVSAGLQGRGGRVLDVGLQPIHRSYFFSAPIRDAAGEIGGIVAVKVDLDPLEAEWRVEENHVLVTDPEGMVVLSTDPSWLYRGLWPRSDDGAERVAESRRDDSSPVMQEPTELLEHGTQLIRMSGSDGVLREYIMARQLMPLTDWKVHVLLDTSYVRRQAQLLLAAGVLVLGTAVSVAAVVVQRRKRLAERIRLQDQAKVELERRVEERTADLARVNAKINEEITERRLTEQQLRQTQADLVQAGKLAGLGQMSAALSHEINQPLAAARNFADSATVLIDRGESERAKANINQIVALIDRMAAIARHLRNVARKPDAPLHDVDLAQALAEAMATCGPRLDRVTLNAALPPDLPLVRAGPVRLQQVLANVLSNAADAMQGQAKPRIEVTARAEAGRVTLDIRDTGPGVPDAIADRIFDPFFTTKQVGSGLGLGLSISFNIMKDFGGELRVANHPGGGAVFTLVFNRSDARDMAAE
jgi:two-component system C4-dicarboxylate transport sensor histidine kinase DctB